MGKNKFKNIKRALWYYSPYLYIALFLCLKFINNYIAESNSWEEKVDWFINIDRMHSKKWYFVFNKWKLEYVALCWFLLFGPRKQEHLWMYRLLMVYYIFEYMDYWLHYNQTDEIIQIKFLGFLSLLVFLYYRFSQNYKSQ